MEPRGCNWWQSVANATGAETHADKPKLLPRVANGCRKERMVRNAMKKGLLQ
jgi:hypothetical protein